MLSAIEQLDERQFTLTVRTLADSLSLGSDASPFRGTGGAYVQSRLYEPGDPVRSIDWRVTARTGRPHVKEYESLKHKPVSLIVDQSRSMFVRSIARSKWRWAAALAGALGLAAVRRSSAVALFGTAQGAGRLRHSPSLSRDAVLQWTAALHRVAASAGTASLSAALNDFDAAAREKCLLIVLSDLYEHAAITVLKKLSARHEVIVLRLQDPAQVSAPQRGFFRGEEAEAGATFLAAAGSRFTDADPLATLRRAGASVFTVRTDTDFVPALRDFLASRGQPQ